jgi:hypothetical protein
MLGMRLSKSSLTTALMFWPAVLHAVVVPSELDGGSSWEGVYPVLIGVIFLVGLYIGVSLQKRIGRPEKKK